MIDVYWKEIFKYNLSVYIQIINCHLFDNGYTTVPINKVLKKLSFPLPKGLLKKEIESVGTYPVVSQSKEEVIGRSNRKDLLVEKDLPLIVYGDHSKTIKYIDYSFVVGADGIKLLKPNSSFYEKYFYYSLIGTQTDTKNYGRHFSLLKNKSIMFPDIKLQKKIALFLDDFSDGNIRNSMYFDEKTENKIMVLHENSIKGLELKTELTYQQTMIKKLRQQILQEAIEGKLTAEWRKRFSPLPRGRTAKQGGGKYEHASVLLERIIAEKNQMIKDKKTKIHKTILPIFDEDKPFPLPHGWAWCRLGDIALINPRNYVSDDIEVGFTPMPLVSASFCDTPKFEKRRWEDVKQGFTHFANNDVIVAKITPCFENSKAGVVENYPNGIGAGTTELHVIRKLTLELNSSYIYFSLKTTQFLQNGKKLMTGAVGQKRVPKEYIENLLFSLPPIAEQNAIVERVKKLIALCDQLETKITENKTHVEQLMRAVLKEIFLQK